MAEPKPISYKRHKAHENLQFDQKAKKFQRKPANYMHQNTFK